MPRECAARRLGDDVRRQRQLLVCLPSRMPASTALRSVLASVGGQHVSLERSARSMDDQHESRRPDQRSRVEPRDTRLAPATLARPNGIARRRPV